MKIDEESVSLSLNFLLANALDEALIFGLSDGLGAAVIHTNSSIPNVVNLSIANKLTEKVEIVGEPGPASQSNYHFRIQFANNQCFPSSPPLTLITPDWSMFALADNAFNITNIYLLSTKSIILDKSGSPDSITTVQVRYTGAMLNNPAVQILQIAVTVGSNVYADIKPDRQPVTGTQMLQVSALTDAGAPSPLIATLVQPRTIPYDGTPWELFLRLVNRSADPVIFAAPSETGSPTPTSVELGVDLDHDAAWALCKSDEADDLTVDPPSNWTGSPAGEIGTGRKTWVFRPDYNKIKQIEPNSAVEFHIGHLKTTLPPGFTNLYVTFREFPNYGTQTVVTQIEKSPLFYNPKLNSALSTSLVTGSNPALTINGNTTGDLLSVNQLGQGNSAHFKGGSAVSIESNLSVLGSTSINGNTPGDLLLVNQTGGGDSAHFKGGKGVSIENGLSVSGDTYINDQTMWFRSGNDQNNGLGWFGEQPQKPFANGDVNGPVLFGYDGGLLGAKQGNNETFALSWKDSGHVGVGTRNPRSLLSVKGGMAVGSTFAENDSASANSLLVEGSVGIGTNNPGSSLSVKGGVAVGSYAESNAAPPSGMIIEGVVGIGNPTVSKAKLQVMGSVRSGALSFAYYSFRTDNSGKAFPFTGVAGENELYNSIYADNRIVGGEFDAFSDVRIKNVIGPSDGARDLATLMNIKVTDYTHKDTVACGNRPQKKLIGQQLLGVYDLALSLSKDVVPDIFQTAKCLDGWIELDTTLQQGEQVKIIPENGNESLVEVTDVEANRFRIAPVRGDGAVFVYGRLVDDFISIDYDAVSMLNVSAAQHIKREKDAEVQSLREENAALRDRLDRLETLIERLVPQEKSAVAGR